MNLRGAVEGRRRVPELQARVYYKLAVMVILDVHEFVACLTAADKSC